MSKEKKEDRFVIVHKEGGSLLDSGDRMVLVDRQTGVSYLYVKSGYSGGLTPLLDADGKPLITHLVG